MRRQPHHIVEVVGHEDHRHVERPPQRGDLLLKTPPHVAIDGGERLVEQQHRRLAGQRPRERHPLALAAGELAAAAAAPCSSNLTEREQLPRAPGPVGARQMPERRRDVALGGEMRKERVFLEHEPDGALMRRHEGAGRGVGPRRRRSIGPTRGRADRARQSLAGSWSCRCPTGRRWRAPRRRRSRTRRRAESDRTVSG